ncbi:MAG: hypothetical protein DMG57_37515 [Acidobacteria bacterium]|nr:MAG: hypothetical protein DMG57_37515 [Acidobacteriota bacterium]
MDAEGILSFGLIWMDYLRRRDAKSTVEGLPLFLPEGKADHMFAPSVLESQGRPLRDLRL